MPFAKFTFPESLMTDQRLVDRFGCRDVRSGDRKGKCYVGTETGVGDGITRRDGPLMIGWRDGVREPLTAKLASSIEWSIPAAWLDGSGELHLAAPATAPTAAPSGKEFGIVEVISLASKCPGWAQGTVAAHFGVRIGEPGERAKAARIAQLKGIAAQVSGTASPAEMQVLPDPVKAKRIAELQRLGKAVSRS